MTINEIITTLENATTSQDINSGLTALFDTLLNNGTITDQEVLSKLARLRAKINIELLS